ncbi:MAG: hypothetical protein FJ294_03165 [Planctomycetes bacterium]|nr:hypothetical protein [Planctomycetota bacterium]
MNQIVVDQLRRLSEAEFLGIYESLQQQGFGPLDHEVAKSLNFRPQAIRNLPMAQRAKRARQILASKKSVEMCYELFGSYLIKDRRELVTGFLDATGVPHEQGMVEDLDSICPAADKLEGAIKDLDGKFAASDVTLYLAMCADQWPQVPEIEAHWRKRAGA